ncbi:MAG: cation-translocating P-type ATPase [Anaerolineae bacterium]
MSTNLSTLPPDQVFGALDTSPDGLGSQEARRRLEKYGPNVLREGKKTPLLVKLMANLTHLMAILLWVAAAMAFVAKMPELGIAVIAVIIINAAFSFWQEYRAERATEVLKKLLPTYARVIRDGEETRLLASDLVPGDVMLLAEGDHISADARLVEEFELRTDNSTLTGEALPVRRTAEAMLRTDLARTEFANLVYAGTTVATGTGRAVVTATGMNTEFGRIADLTANVREEPSPMQVQIERLVRRITLLAVGLGVLFFALALLLGVMKVAEAFIFGVGIIVAFVPEGLLPTVTLALAMGVQRMARRHALVKKLSAVETLGSTTVICTDKTGTLTQNEMTVRRLWAGGQEYGVSGSGYEPKGHIELGPRVIAPGSDPDVGALLTAASLCNNARLLPPNGESKRWSILGDPTEAALLVAAGKYGLEPDDLTARQPRQRELPFESRRKRMSTINACDGQRMAYVKGAPNEVLSLCTHIQIRGNTRTLDATTRADIRAANDRYARQALRVLAVACRPLLDNEDDGECTADTVEQNLTFLGLVAMMDPPRPEVARAVELCHQAGVRIIMITGDYGLTAESVARRVGIVKGDRVRTVTGVELEQMPESELQRVLRDEPEVIFARVSPEHKLRVVSALKALDEVVAVTGDGVNDAPALKRADIGVAMGMTGTDVAKEAADMILTDDNFASIVAAIEEGRAVYANIKKFTTYIFASNMPEAIPFIAFVLSGGRIPLPLTVMQILAVDLGTDMVPALGLGADTPEPGLMEHPPRDRKAQLIDAKLLLRAYGWLGLFEGVFSMIAFYWVYWTRGFAGVLMPLPGPAQDAVLYATATTATLSSIIPEQIANVFACRSERASIFKIGFLNNKLILVGIATEVALIAAINYLRPFQIVFGTAPLRATDWLFFLTIIPVLLFAEEGRKWLVRRRARQQKRGEERCALSSSAVGG